MRIMLMSDYRHAISGIDKYGRRKCDNCGKLRKVNAYWPSKNVVVCTECSHITEVVYRHSVTDYRVES